MSEDYSLGTYSKLAETAEKKQQPATSTPDAQPRTQNVNNGSNQAPTTPRNHDTVIPRSHE
jgi:hypothetical protein